MVVEEKYQLGSMPDDIEKGGKANCVLVIWHKKKIPNPENIISSGEFLESNSNH